MRPYKYKAWCIEKRSVIQKGDNVGKWTEWKEIKYPGNMQETALGLLDLSLQNFVSSEVTNLESLELVLTTLTVKIEESTAQIMNQLEKIKVIIVE